MDSPFVTMKPSEVFIIGASRDWDFSFGVTVHNFPSSKVRFNANEQRYAWNYDQGYPKLGHLSIQQIAGNLNRLNIEANQKNQNFTEEDVRQLLAWIFHRIGSPPKVEEDHWDWVTSPYDLEGGDQPTVKQPTVDWPKR